MTQARGGCMLEEERDGDDNVTAGPSGGGARYRRRGVRLIRVRGNLAQGHRRRVRHSGRQPVPPLRFQGSDRGRAGGALPGGDGEHRRRGAEVGRQRPRPRPGARPRPRQTGRRRAGRRAVHVDRRVRLRPPGGVAADVLRAAGRGQRRAGTAGELPPRLGPGRDDRDPSARGGRRGDRPRRRCHAAGGGTVRGDAPPGSRRPVPGCERPRGRDGALPSPVRRRAGRAAERRPP